MRFQNPPPAFLNLKENQESLSKKQPDKSGKQIVIEF